MTVNKGVVYLVGAGPGAPELLTLGARHVIEQADIILYDGLVNEAILDFAPLECQKICVGKRGNRGAWIQSQIDDLIVRSAREHQRR
jgi:siroheme synthase